MRMLEPRIRRDRRIWVPRYRRKHGGLEYYDDAVGRRMAFVAVAWVVGLIWFGIMFVGGNPELEFEGPAWERVLAFVFGGIVSALAAFGSYNGIRSWVEKGVRRKDDDQ